jgi:hypothetical protein
MLQLRVAFSDGWISLRYIRESKFTFKLNI